MSEEQNEAPAEIWLQTSIVWPPSKTWSDEPTGRDDIRYVRADLKHSETPPDEYWVRGTRYIRVDHYEQMQRRANEFELKAARLEQELERLQD